MEFFDKATPGDLNSILTRNIETIKTATNYKFTDLIISLARGVTGIIFSIVLAADLAAVIIPVVLLLIVLTFIAQFVMNKLTLNELKSYGEAGRIAQESLSSLRTVLAFGMEKKCTEKYSKHLKEIETISLKKGFSMGLFTALSSGGQYLLFAIVFYIEINLFRANCEVYRPWDLFLSFSCLLILSGAYFSKSFSYLKEFFEAKTAAKSVFDIIECQPDISTENDKKTLPILKGHVEFEKVYFNYPQRPTVEVLKNLSLKIDAGKTLALVGPSGSGKSTVIGLLQQFYSPTLGTIKIDGVPIDQLNIKWLRDQMALVTQEPVLFSCSIKENIRLGRLEATDAEIEEAAKQSNAHNFIAKLKNGYETLVGERGIQLSGGQKQRIAIARALIRNPRILLLDEATSALDYQNERIVQEALERAKIGRTTIIIAHRLSTIRNADLIVCVRDGEQAEMGNHDELMNRKGLYYELVVSQTFKKIELEGVSREDSIQASEASIEGLKRPISVGQIEKESKPSIEIFKYEKKILTNHLPESFWLVSGVLASIIIGLIFVSIRYLFNDVWDVFYILDDEKQIQESIKYTLILVLLTLIYALMQTYSSYSIERCGCRLTTRLRSKLFESMLRQEVAFHDQQQHKSSLLTTRLSTGPDSCRALTSDLFVLVSQKITVLVAAVIICLFLSWKLTVVASAFLLVSMCVSMASFHVTTKISTGGGGEYEQGRLGVETIENIRTMVSLNLEKFFIGQFEKSNDKVNLLMMNTHAFLYSMSNCMLFFLQASLFTVGFILAKNDGLSISEFFKINSILVLASVDLLELFTRFPNLAKAIQLAKSVFEIVERQSNIDPFSEKGLKPDKTIGKLRFDNVHFTYPSRPDEPVLQGLNLCVNKGEVNALVGYSGAGKSTIVGLLLRFYDVNSGSIYLDDVDIRDLNIQWLRSQIGLVSQEPSLFNISIYENICFGDLSRIKIEMHEVVDYATRSSIHNKIELLPEKYDTPVGSKGSQQLSGGEKQRIAIARALIRKPNILLLDEATSSLDSQSELIVQEVLDKAKEGRTCIVIAHRLATIRNSNKISVIKDGKVVEEGSHDELINLNGVYFRLLHSA